jgi:uncharacterized BrkB/YihY/UPF0761 family membrane protein
MNRKGAFSVMALILGFVTVVCYVALLPVLNSVIAGALPYTDPWTTLIIQLIPLIMLLMIVVGIIYYGQPEYYRPAM